jgi:hypothetical protein
MESLIPIIIKCIAGAGGGYLGNMLKGNGLGMVGNLLAGAVGGNALPAILGMAGMAGATGGGGMDLMSIGSALLGGGAGSLLGGLIKKAE